MNNTEPDMFEGWTDGEIARFIKEQNDPFADENQQLDMA
jgi:hypothetical protein